MLTIGWVALGVLTAGVRSDEIKKYRDFEVEGIAYSRPYADKEMPVGVGAAVRVRGSLPGSGPWVLRILRVENADADPKALAQRMYNDTEWSPDSRYIFAFSPIRADHSVKRLRIIGELVHTFPVEEVATFPKMHLTTPPSASASRSPMMHVWQLPKGGVVEATTPKGLKMENPKRMNGFGYSGPGFSDMAVIPIGVDPATLGKGIEAQMGGGRFVDRIDAWPFTDADGHPLYKRRIYSHAQPDENGLFGLVGPQFDPNPTLTFHVVRHVADRCFRFRLVVPVQANRDLEPTRNSTLQPPIWPSEKAP